MFAIDLGFSAKRGFRALIDAADNGALTPRRPHMVGAPSSKP
jgi:hypothetical protein